MIEFCTGMQESEEELDKFFHDNPNFPHLDPLSEEFDIKYDNLES